MSGFSLNWFLVMTVPGQEQRAKSNLTLLGVCAWLPRYSKVARQRGELRFLERMLFPGYCFVAFEPGRSQWMLARDAPGVLGVIAAAGVPLRIPNDEVATLMSCCMTGFFDQDMRRVGSKVRIVRGDRAGVMGRIVKAPDDDKLTVLLTACGSPTFQQVSLDEIRIAA